MWWVVCTRAERRKNVQISNVTLLKSAVRRRRRFRRQQPGVHRALPPEGAMLWPILLCSLEHGTLRAPFFAGGIVYHPHLLFVRSSLARVPAVLTRFHAHPRARLLHTEVRPESQSVDGAHR